jgi:hypothetical protein
MVSITKGDRPMTVINVFTVAPEEQARLVELLTRATDSSIRHIPGSRRQRCTAVWTAPR